MEHLVNFGRSLPIQIPYISRHRFTPPLSTYPSRRGLDLESLYLGDFTGHEPEDVYSLLQEWLFFGPLYHVFAGSGLPFDLDDFIRRDENGQQWLTTEKLPTYANAWYFRPHPDQWRGGRSDEQRVQEFQHVYAGLRVLHRFVLRYCGRHARSSRLYPEPTFWPVSGEMALAVIVVCDSLQHLVFEGTGCAFNMDWGISGLLHDRMVDAGWCPSRLRVLETTQQVGLMHLADSLGGPGHGERTDHAGCVESRCEWENVDERTYQTRHVSEECSCEFVPVSVSEIEGILREGGIPVIQCRSESQGLKVAVSERMGDARGNYVAISHVWSDGLGNPSSNSFPTCQLQRLQRLVDVVSDSTDPPSWWWFDTLCVPVGQEHKEARKMAIKKMRATYEKAAKVLVLDGGLQALSVSTSPLEIYIRFKTSKWMSRLWTLQEGVLAGSAVLQFQDGTMTIQELRETIHQTEHRARRFYARYQFDIRTVLGTFLNRQARFDGGLTQPQNIRLQSYLKLLATRSTSKRADETICVATLLDIGQQKLDELLQHEDNDHEGRMISLLCSLDNISIMLLFQPPPRLNILGFRWAPTSFLECFRGAKSDPYRPMNGLAQIGPHGYGLHFQRAGLALSCDDSDMPLIGQDFQLQVQGEGHQVLRVSYPDMLGDFTDREALNSDGTRNLCHPAIILGQQLYSAGIVDGVLVDAYEKDASPLKCNFIAWVGLVKASESNFDTEGMRTISAQILSDEQEWLVM